MNKREIKNNIIEYVLTGKGSNNLVIEQYVDLNWVMRGVRHSYSNYNTLIKYSKKEHSPVSLKPSDLLYLGTPDSYGDLNTDALVRDDSEGIFPEELDWKNQGCEQMEDMKKRFMQISSAVHGNLKLNVTWKLPNHYLLFCTSIDPVLNAKRQEQMRLTNPCYNSMASIANPPTSLAKQLGIDLRKQIETYFVMVFHGPVIYLDEDKTSEFIVRSREKLSYTFPTTAYIPLFVKNKKYEVQQEYRFVVSTPFYRHSANYILLNVSDDLRKLFSLVK